MPKYSFEPDFNELLCVLNQQKPSRPVLFEFFMNQTVYELMAGHKPDDDSAEAYYRYLVDAFHSGGYDYATVMLGGFGFPAKERHYQKTISLNEGFMISDVKSFNEYQWPDPEKTEFLYLDMLMKYMPEGMKLMVHGPGGVLENAVSIVGFENLCFMLSDEPDLAEQIFTEIGSRFLRYYQIAAEHEAVGLLMVNDDWGFKTQTFLSPDDMRRFVFPWHKKIAEAAHLKNKPAVLHSCGFANDIMDDIIDDMKYNGKHSYEDVILTVEESYKRWGDRIGILGGIDVDFLINSSPEDIKKRSAAMLDMAEEKGSYALGSGNSIPEYIPYEKYRAMIDTALARR